VAEDLRGLRLERHAGFVAILADLGVANRAPWWSWRQTIGVVRVNALGLSSA